MKSVMLCLGVVLAFAGASRAASADQIDAAIQKGVTWLYSRPDFKKNGNWELAQKRSDKGDGASQTGAQWGGRTALLTYALLASGESPTDPQLKPAIDFLKKSDDVIGYYALGLRPQVWLYLPANDEVRALANRDFKLLLAGIEKDPTKKDVGFYDYTLGYDREEFTLSASQYGVLGMWACAQLGIEVPAGSTPESNYWQLVEKNWKRIQDKKTGGWAYRDGPVSPSMTAAGIATLFITQDYLRGSQGVNCQGNQKSEDIDRAVKHLVDEFPKVLNDADFKWRNLTFFGIERIGVASGLKYLGTIDWYQAGADYLVKSQQSNGRWKDTENDEVSTAYALLFLSRGREPVMMNKLKYDLIPRIDAKTDVKPVEGFWNQRSRDVANATRFVGRQIERPLNWQIVDMNVAEIGDLRDAPIAYISGSQPLKLSPTQTQKLKQYIEEGGMVVFNADCGRRTFSASIPALFRDLFPYEFRPLPDSHPIFKNQQFKGEKWKRRPSIQGLSNGVRELALIFDEDVGKSFQTNESTRNPEHFEVMADIYQYAIDKKNSLVKGRSYVVEVDPAIKATGSVKLARLKYPGKWDPEPGGWRRLAAVMHNKQKTDLQVSTVDLVSGDLIGFHAAHLTGTGAVKLSEDAIKKLKSFVDGGGLLIIDAAGGDSEFAGSIEGQLGQISASTKDAGELPIAPTDSIFTVDGLRVPEFRYRAFSQSSVGASTVPRLRGTRTGDRYGMIYSPDDLSAGLVGNDVDGIRGYTPITATEIMIRLMLYAQNSPSGKAATRPATAPATRPTTVPATRPAVPAAKK